METYKKIKYHLTSHGIKQIYLSRKTGIKKSTLNAALNGKRRLYVDEFGKICSVLNVNPIDFLGGKK